MVDVVDCRVPRGIALCVCYYTTFWRPSDGWLVVIMLGGLYDLQPDVIMCNPNAQVFWKVHYRVGILND
jgi:hypothetical protein